MKYLSKVNKTIEIRKRQFVDFSKTFKHFIKTPKVFSFKAIH